MYFRPKNKSSLVLSLRSRGRQGLIERPKWGGDKVGPVVMIRRNIGSTRRIYRTFGGGKHLGVRVKTNRECQRPGQRKEDTGKG